jgi:hypothetical protein
VNWRESKIVRRVARWLGVLLVAAATSGGQVKVTEIVRLADADRRCWQEADRRFSTSSSAPSAARQPRPKVPKVLHEVLPSLPSLPEGASFSGCSVLLNEVLVAPSGSVAVVWTVRRDAAEGGCPPYEQAVADAIAQWNYERVLVDGKPVAFCVAISRSVDLGWR